MILKALARNPLFMSAALPLKVFPPMFNRYETGAQFGNHVDTAMRLSREAPHRVRTDLSATLFLSEPGEYEGGELVIEDTFGPQRAKLPAGHLLLYSSTHLHRVETVTRGQRLAAIFWVQSMVRDDGERGLLFELDRAIQTLNADVSEHPALTSLTGVYHNLLRRWADA